jgi:hypothetical protein
LLGVPQEIVEEENQNIEIPRKTPNVPQTISGI